MKRLSIFFLVCIFLLAFFIRVYRVGEVPSGFHRDEAFLGYNAYSILKTGRDITGNFLPTHLASFIYTPAGYSYLSIPFIALFGLTEFSVRFASLFFGSLTVVLTFFLAKKLFELYDKDLKEGEAASIAYISAIILVFSPWHINLSRTASVSAIVVFLITLGVYCYILFVTRKKLWILFASFLSFSLSLSFYIAPYSFLPLFIPFMLFLLSGYKKMGNKIGIGLYAMLILLPLLLTILLPTLSLRARSLSIFTSPSPQLVIDEQIRTDGVNHMPLFVTRIFHNKPALYESIFLQNYFKHFSYDFLFTDQGLPDRYRVPLQGLLYLIELPFLLLGAWLLINKRSVAGYLLVGWILLVPIGSSLTLDDVPNLQRTLLVFPAMSILVAYGVWSIKRILLHGGVLGKTIAAFLIAIAFYQVLFYFHQYYTHAPVYRPWYRQDGYKELVAKVNKYIPNYKKAIITDRESAPAIFFLFYSHYDPALFQKETRNTSMRDFDRINFGEYEFSQEECPFPTAKTPPAKKKTVVEKDVLYVNSGLCDESEKAEYLDMIKREDNSTVFEILYKL